MRATQHFIPVTLDLTFGVIKGVQLVRFSGEFNKHVPFGIIGLK